MEGETLEEVQRRHRAKTTRRVLLYLLLFAIVGVIVGYAAWDYQQALACPSC